MLTRVSAGRDAGRFAELRFLATTQWWLDIAQQGVPEEVGGLGVHAAIVGASRAKTARFQKRAAFDKPL